MNRERRDAQPFNDKPKTKQEKEKLNKFKAACEKVGKDVTNVPNMPDRYLWDTEEGPSITHIDVRAFKKQWDESMEHSPMIVRSREEGVNYAGKEELRRRIMNRAVGLKIAVAINKQVTPKYTLNSAHIAKVALPACALSYFDLV